MTISNDSINNNARFTNTRLISRKESPALSYRCLDEKIGNSERVGALIHSRDKSE